MNLSGVEPAGEGGEPQLTLRGDRRDHVQAVPGTGGLHHRGARRPGPRWCRRGGRERIPASSAKYTVAPSFLASFAMAGYSLSFQAAHLRLVGLPGPPQRPLRRQAEPVQQPAHRRGRHLHAELAADQLPDHVPGPQREVERQLTGVLTGDPAPRPAASAPRSASADGPAPAWPRNASRPPARSRAQPAIHGRARAYPAPRPPARGCAPPASTWSTARSRIASSVRWSSLRPSFSRIPQCPRNTPRSVRHTYACLSMSCSPTGSGSTSGRR